MIKAAFMKLFEQIPLPNGLAAEVWDLSRAIATDTARVEILIRIPVPLSPDDFDAPSRYEKVCAAFGDAITYERRLLQSFVRNAQRDAVFRILLDHFKQASLPYLSGPAFRARFIAAKYRELLQNPYKYRVPQRDGGEPA